MDRSLFGTRLIRNAFVIEVKQTVSSLADVTVLQELEAVRKALRECGLTRVVFDLTLATYFGSSLLEAMRTIWKDIVERKGKMVLCNASEVGAEVLTVVKFDKMWPVTNSFDEAIRIVSE